jgi:site-specific DNA-methyltransferase (cytosine-N4-specific)
LTIRIILGDAYDVLDRLQPGSVDCCFTSPSPPFSAEKGIGSENRLSEYISNLLIIFRKVAIVLKNSGSLWVEMGDYLNEQQSLRCTPEDFAVSMISDKWILRSKLIWHRPDDSTQHEQNRFKRDWEYLFMFTKSLDYYFNPKYNNTSVFTFPYMEPKPNEFASGFPEGLIEVALQSTVPSNGTVMDIFCDSGVTGVVALRNKMNFIGIEILPEKITKIRKRLGSIRS